MGELSQRYLEHRPDESISQRPKVTAKFVLDGIRPIGGSTARILDVRCAARDIPRSCYVRYTYNREPL